MTIEKLIEKAREFEKKNERITWKPNDFPEDMSESSTLDELVSEGDNMYDALKEAVDLIHDLAVELEQWRAQKMGNKTYSELIKDARRKLDFAKEIPSASGTERLLADSLNSIIEALDVIYEKADKAFSNTVYSNIYR